MALKKDFITSQGIEIKDAYIRVYAVDCGTKTHATAKISVQVAQDKPMIENVIGSFAFDLEGANPFAQAYAFAKTLPAFAGAQDC
jgi:hypothetical protein